MTATRPLTRAQVRELDRLAIEELGIPGVVLMENAGRGAAGAILRAGGEGRLGSFSGAPGEVVVVLCGGGNNGGDGYVAARYLREAGVDVVLCETVDPERLTPDAATFRRVTAAMGLRHLRVDPGRSFEDAGAPPRPALFVDGLLGTGFHGTLREPAAGVLERAAAYLAPASTPVVALDVPSGLDVDTGEADPRTLPARLTLTFAASKVGFGVPGAGRLTGEVEVISIGAPASLLDRAAALPG